MPQQLAIAINQSPNTQQMTKKEIGEFGENAAANLLIEKGYKILERNYRVGHLEVDIIALKDNTIAFVEVKTRSVDFIVSPSEAVSIRKQSLIIKAADGYVCQFNRQENARFDIINVLHDNGNVVSVEHLEDAYLPSVRTY